MTALALRDGELNRYMAEVTKIPLLSRDEEHALAVRYRDHEDLEAAHKLVVSNLRFVVRVAWEYRGYGMRILDLVQEGNVGLMEAVKRFNPDKGYRLITYAVWWIRAKINEYVMRTWSLVKLGSGKINRKLFYKLRSARSQLEQETQQDRAERKELAEHLGIDESHIEEMSVRMAAKDFYLDAPRSDEGTDTWLDGVADTQVQTPEQETQQRETAAIAHEVLQDAQGELDERETYILNARLLSDEPATFADVGKELGVTRQRAQQLESRLLKKLRVHAERRLNPPQPAAA